MSPVHTSANKDKGRRLARTLAARPGTTSWSEDCRQGRARTRASSPAVTEPKFRLVSNDREFRNNCPSGKRTNDLDEVIAAVAVPPGKFDELAHPDYELARGGTTGNRYPAASFEFEQALVAKDVQGAEDGVLVYTEHGGNVFGEWKPFTRTRLALSDRTPDLCCNLVVKEGRLGPVNVDTQHGPSHSSTMTVGLDARRANLAVADPEVPDTEALFKEAHRRRRNRRLFWGAVGTVVVGLVFLVATLYGSTRSGSGARSVQQPGLPKTASVAVPGEVVGWTSSAKVVVISTATGRTIRTLASGVSGLTPGDPVISIGSHGTVFFDGTSVRSGPPVDEIFRVPVSGGPVSEVAEGSDPAVSPNGRMLAFIGSKADGEPPYLWNSPSPGSTIGIDIASISPTGRIEKINVLAPGPAQNGQGASELSWSPDAGQLSFDLLNGTTNATTAWTIAVGGRGAGSLDSARQIPMNRPGLSWNGYWAGKQDGQAIGIGVLRSATEQKVVTIDPVSGEVVSDLFAIPTDVVVCTPTISSAPGQCWPDFTDPVIGDSNGNAVLLAGAIPSGETGRGVPAGDQDLWIWKEGKSTPVALAHGVLVAAWASTGQ
jgi:hypothetical protein